MKTKLGMAALAALALTGCATASSTNDLPVVKNFDAERYMGTWHELARLPKWYETGLTNVTATYSLDGQTLRITNRGMKDGKEKTSTAIGYFAGPADEGAFRISFFRPFYGDYRILWLAPDYNAALVTGGDRSSLWVLARSRDYPTAQRDVLIQQAKEWGFDVSNLEFPL